MRDVGRIKLVKSFVDKILCKKGGFILEKQGPRRRVGKWLAGGDIVDHRGQVIPTGFGVFRELGVAINRLPLRGFRRRGQSKPIAQIEKMWVMTSVGKRGVSER
jgi:hypothetical protein